MTLNRGQLDPSYPSELKTLADIIRKARIDKGLQQKQLASLLSVDDTSVGNWETPNITPAYRHVRKLEEALKVQLPPELIFRDYPTKDTTLGMKIKQKRLGMRLSQKEFARLLGVGPDAVRDWEAGRHRPSGRCLHRIGAVLAIT